MGRHAPQLELGQLELADREPELLPLAGIGGRRLERGLGEPGGTAPGLQPACGESLHLEVEALPLAGLLADQILARDEVALEAEREGVHAAVAGRGIGLPVQHAAVRLAHLEFVAGERVLRHDEEREAAGAGGQVGVRARQERDHVRPPRERTPRLGPRDAPATLHALRAAADGRGVGLGDRDRHHDLARRDGWQPSLLLRLRAAVQECLGQDLRARDEASRGGERRDRELLGRDDHHQVPHPLPAVLLRHRHAEVAELGHLTDDRLGNHQVLAVDALGERRHGLPRELARGVAREDRGLGLEPGVVRAAGADHLAPDLPEVSLVLRRADGGRDRRRTQTSGDHALGNTEVLAVALDAGA